MCFSLRGTLLWVVLLHLCIASAAWAANDEQTSKVKIITVSAETEPEIREAARIVDQDLRDFQSKNPNLAPEVVLVADPAEKQENRAEHRKRLTLTIIRGALGTTAATWSLLIKTDGDFWRVLPVSITVGMMTMGLQYHYKTFFRYLGNSRSKVEKFLRWASLEAGFLGVVKIGTTLAGISQDSWADASTSVMAGAAIGMLTQGLWDTAISEERSLELVLHPERRSSIELRSQAKLLLVSAASIALNLAFIEQVPHSFWLIAAMGATGAAKYVSVHRKVKKCDELLK